MRILIDGDACNVTNIAEKIAAENGIECHIYCDTSHIIHSDYSQMHVVDSSPNAVDFAIINFCRSGDIIITNDSGLAAMALIKKCSTLNCKGIIYNNKNITSFLNRRYMRQDAKRKTKRNKINGVNICDRIKHHHSFPVSLQQIISSYTS